MERQQVSAADVKRLIRGEEEAFRRVYQVFGDRLYYFARKLGLGREDAEEIVQETFIRLWLNRQSIDPAIPIGGFIIIIARNQIYNTLKKAAVRKQYQSITSFDDEPTGEIDSGELHSLILQAVDEMPAKRQQVFRMSRFEGRLNQQIAEELGISKSTVENQLNKALRFLRKRLRDSGYGVLLLMLL